MTWYMLGDQITCTYIAVVIYGMRLICPRCHVTDLTKQGPYRRTRLVLDIDGFYILASEYLHGSRCKKNQISWNPEILDQLDPGTRSRFPVQVLYRTACDKRVIALLHQRGLGKYDLTDTCISLSKILTHSQTKFIGSSGCPIKQSLRGI